MNPARTPLVAVVLGTLNSVSQERNAEHREKYTTLVPNIREACNGVPFMFLSGTTTLSVTKKVLALPEHKVTKVFTHARALPNNLVFSVERKLDNRQVCFAFGI